MPFFFAIMTLFLTIFLVFLSFILFRHIFFSVADDASLSALISGKIPGIPSYSPGAQASSKLVIGHPFLSMATFLSLFNDFSLFLSPPLFRFSVSHCLWLVDIRCAVGCRCAAHDTEVRSCDLFKSASWPCLYRNISTLSTPHFLLRSLLASNSLFSFALAQVRSIHSSDACRPSPQQPPVLSQFSS